MFPVTVPADGALIRKTSAVGATSPSLHYRLFHVL